VIDALGTVGSLLLVGGTSDIAVATARRYLQERPLRIVLAARDTPRRAAVAAELRAAGATVEEVDFDADDPGSPKRMVAEAAAGGDIDVAVIAFGRLGD
jgi:decaprenylphospho-beta-D-erythro-pentofuranosid-2-ulose 2-reductase